MPRLPRLVGFLCAAAISHAFQGPAATPSKGSIEGRVLNGRTGAPLKRATVRLMGSMPTALAAVAAPAPVPAPAGPGAATIGPAGVRPSLITRETDEQGRFSFAGLDPGQYRLTAERQGFLRQSWGARKYSGGNTPITVGDGQSVKGIDFRMMPQGVIIGKVLDEDGEPMAGVQVRAQRSYIRNGVKVWNNIANATTSDIGEYRLPELKPGRYFVMATPRPGPGSMMPGAAATDPLPATPELTYAATYYPSTADPASAVPSDVGEGGEVPNVDIRLVKSRVFRVRGKVTGLPPDGGGGRRGMVQVILSPREGGRGGEMSLMGQARGADGGFEIRNVPPGQYLAHTQTQGGGQPQYAAVAPVDVIGSHADGVVLHMASGGDVQGTVKVVDTETPIDVSKVQVSLRPVGFGGQAPRARVGADLAFTLKGVPPLRYAVSANGFPETCYVKSIRYGGADVGPDGVEMTSGGVMEIVLSATAAAIDVVVSAGDNKTAAGAQVLLLKDGIPESVRTADESGMLSLKGLKPASYRVIGWEDVDPEQLWDPEYLRKFENEGKSVKLDASGHEAIQIKAIPAQ
ncbi:MAG TPA: carboxypeptidase-like regulatory domain-containing protein [Candidatus Acidoferrum sp.]|nr:carboxypeptidase-like regulatory domain-containing protein [Candidatus Acidoferrum sp.]